MAFNVQESKALADEIVDSASLLRHGFVILADLRFSPADVEPLFACLAGGTEKLLKLTFGLMTLDEGEHWPSKATMREAGHKIVELDETVRQMLANRHSRSTAPALIQRLLEMSEGHPGVIRVLRTLERYAVNGRFYNLDLLSGRLQGEAPPAELWHELELDVIDANPDMLDWAEAGEHARVRQVMNRVIARSLGIWCELVVRSWITGVCGPAAQRHSSGLDPGHPPPRMALH